MRLQREWTARKRSFHSPCAGCCSSLLRHISAWHPFQIPDTAAGTRARRDSLPGLALTSGSSSRPSAIFSMGSPCLLFFFFSFFFFFLPFSLVALCFLQPPLHRSTLMMFTKSLTVMNSGRVFLALLPAKRESERTRERERERERGGKGKKTQRFL